jgi:hypothetical protein
MDKEKMAAGKLQLPGSQGFQNRFPAIQKLSQSYVIFL